MLDVKRELEISVQKCGSSSKALNDSMEFNLYGFDTSYDNTLAVIVAINENCIIPSMVLCTCNAVYMQTYHTILQVQAENCFSLQESKMLEPVPDLHALRFEDLENLLILKFHNRC
ncbi:hypothetical protein ACH5RR_010139 [Cinchona calisaya]|uniref:Uncharacterized protein n=1 Tax=Cinchona calisaya TaxID=153742 RepID=A0ABD3AGD1_9GENT